MTASASSQADELLKTPTRGPRENRQAVTPLLCRKEQPRSLPHFHAPPQKMFLLHPRGPQRFSGPWKGKLDFCSYKKISQSTPFSYLLPVYLMLKNYFQWQFNSELPLGPVGLGIWASVGVETNETFRAMEQPRKCKGRQSGYWKLDGRICAIVSPMTFFFFVINKMRYLSTEFRSNKCLLCCRSLCKQI